MTDTERVYVSARTNGTRLQRLHTDPECPRLNSTRKVVTKDREQYPDVSICEWCKSETGPHGTSGSAGPWQSLLDANPENVGLSPPGERNGHSVDTDSNRGGSQ